MLALKKIRRKAHAFDIPRFLTSLPSWRGTLQLTLAAWFVAAASFAMAIEAQELQLGSDEWPPFTGSPGKQRAAIDLVHTALDRAGVQATTSIFEWKQVENKIRHALLDGSAAIWRTEQRQKDLLFSAPYLENRLVLIGRKGSDVSAKRMADLAGKRVAAVGQYAYGQEVEKAVGVIFVKARNDQDSLDKLRAGEVEYMLVDELVARHLMTHQAEEVAKNLEIGSTHLARRTLHFAIRRDLANADEIIMAFNSEIRQMQADGTYAEILQIGWIRADVDGDGLYELIPYGDQIGERPPSWVYDVFGEVPAEKPPEKERVVIQGNIYKGWDAIPDRYKQPPSPGGDTSIKRGNIFMTLKF